MEQFDGYDLIYDRNAGYDYTYIDELYNITDLDIYIISPDVHTSPYVQGELKAMKDRGIPIIPVRFEGYEGDEIRQVCNPESVDALPVDLADGKNPDEETIQFMASRMNQSLARFDRRKRDKNNKKIMKTAKQEQGGYRIFGWFVENGKRIDDAVKSGAIEGTRKFANTAVYILLLALLLAAITGKLYWENIVEIMKNLLKL
ncbi:MAG: hypothetical protein IIZ68_02010 [Clostridia bacterium]|nr:hypothetical protein [Clostridia bacterium]